jgi:hypothetical protein
MIRRAIGKQVHHDGAGGGLQHSLPVRVTGLARNLNCTQQ